GGNKPGGNGGNSGNHRGSSGGRQSSATAMAFGLPALATPGSGWQDQVRYLDKDIQNQNAKLKAAQASLNAMNESLSRDKAA
ncbi:hypothetical protein ACJV1X_27180, partial [Klebsiella pneumoniae]